MIKLNKKKTSILSILGIITILAVMFSVATPMKKAKADYGGSTGTRGGVATGSHATSGTIVDCNTMGYRIYFAPDKLDYSTGNFQSDIYGSALIQYAPLAVYTFRDYGGSVVHPTVHTWDNYWGIDGYTAKEADFNYVFGNVFPDVSESIPAVDFRSTVDFAPFADYCNNVLSINHGVAQAFTSYQNYLRSTYSASDFSGTQLDAYNFLTASTTTSDEVMMIAEPVYVALDSGSGKEYTVSLSDWGNDGHFVGDYGGLICEWSGAITVINRTPKLNNFYTSFMYDGITCNSGDGMWYGFGYYSSGVQDGKNKLGIGFNLLVSYSGDLKRNNTTGDNISTSLSETMTASSKENPDSSKFVGDPQYDKALTTWDDLANASTAEAHTHSALWMAGWTWNNVAWAGDGTPDSWMPWEGATKTRKLNNLKETVDSSMTGRVSGTSLDYVLGVFGHMTADTVDAIEAEDMYIDNVTSIKLNVQEGATGNYDMFYGDATNMNDLKNYVDKNIKTVTSEAIVTPKNGGYAFGSTMRAVPYMNQPAFNDEFATRLSGAFNSEPNPNGVKISSWDLMHDMPNETDDSGIMKGQETPDEVKESLARIQGATVFANAVNIDQPQRTDPVIVKDDSAMTLSIVTMEKKTYIDNYLGATKVMTTGGEDSPSTNEFEFLGRTYTSNHTPSTSTLWYLNNVSTGTIGSGSDQEVSFLELINENNRGDGYRYGVDISSNNI